MKDAEYLNKFKTWLNTLLGQFPESGAPMPEYGDGIRRVVYHRYNSRSPDVAMRNPGFNPGPFLGITPDFAHATSRLPGWLMMIRPPGIRFTGVTI